MPQKDSEPSITAPRLPDPGTKPYRIAQWKHLWRDEFVELRRGNRTEGVGWVDDITEDGTTMWIHLSAGNGRVMLHQEDGIDVWRVDARICQDRPSADNLRNHSTAAGRPGDHPDRHLSQRLPSRRSG
ncbi:hypothetical protein QFZ23_004777 [Arthrobacter globiformis]|uniref:hypothetical protein n=1 Tax=Arthrobacter globiformis TaxID=1665 RepID=UPI0027876615|nr:hypothetical protein [Arthrobacter globiformis]MDQ1060812.1 hypothetical protein [Arthrobacter globiformis]